MAIVLIAPFPMPGMYGSYNKISGLIWCTSHPSCTHEIAHKIDDEAGWISHSDEFYNAVKSLAPSVERGFLNKNMEEIYASIFERARGDSDAIPEQLRAFYNFNRAKVLMRQYER